MTCPKCGDDHHQVIDSRKSTSPVNRAGPPDRFTSVIRRRRQCSDCGERWTTYEIDAAELERMAVELAKKTDVRRVLSDLRRMMKQGQLP